MQKSFLDSDIRTKEENLSHPNSIDTYTLLQQYTQQTAKERVEHLQKEIQHHNTLYFIHDAPEISDDDFDMLIRERDALIQAFSLDLEEENIAPTVVSSLEKATHTQKMYSLEKAHTQEELTTFISRIAKEYGEIEYWVDVKLDGLAVELLYHKGVLTKAITRGDGIVGEVVTHTIRTIANIPQTLQCSSPPEYIEVRGEVILPKEAFQKVNIEQSRKGEKTFANPRNMASGSIRQLNASIAKERGLQLYVYSIGESTKNFTTQSAIMQYLKECGFSLPQGAQLVANANNIWDVYNTIATQRELLEYEIDGIVLKVNSLEVQEALGYTARTPRFALAMKFPARYAQTKILDITLHVGRTGILTPVAHLEPVAIGGVIVSKATLHNRDEIEEKDIRIGDEVLIKRAGDVIPYIVNSLPEKRDATSVPFIFPSQCPSCGSELIFSTEEVGVYCANIDCPAVAVQKGIHFVSKGGMDIQGFGKKWVEILYKKKILTGIADIFSLSYKKLASLEGMGDISATNLLEAIERSKQETPLHKFIFSLGIRHVGEQTAKALAKHFGTVEAIANASYEELIRIHDIGEEVASSIRSFFSNLRNREMLQHLQEQGINPIEKKKDKRADTPFANKIMLFTGTLSMPRSKAQSLAEEAGAIVVSTISSKVNILIAGESAGSKLQKAQSLGITILSEEEFIALLDK